MAALRCATRLLCFASVLSTALCLVWIHKRGDLTDDVQEYWNSVDDPSLSGAAADDFRKQREDDGGLKPREEPEGEGEALACGPCVPWECPALEEICPAGVVTDLCGCCEVCGRREGEKCDVPDAGPSLKGRHGSCGEHLECRERLDSSDNEPIEAYCTCKDKYEVCGMDNQTFPTVCAWKEAVILRGDKNPQIHNWGPCKSEPKIVTPPEDTYEPFYGNFSLPCEAVGNPTPVIFWELIKENGELVQLPGDYPHVSVQHRGGPESHMTSSWVQITRLEPRMSGTYICLASNSNGEVRASANVGVYRIQEDSRDSRNKEEYFLDDRP